MRAVVIILMLLIAILESDIRTTVTLALTVLWLIYTIYVCIKLLKAKDKKIESNEVLIDIPNDTNVSHIRFFYKRRLDNKVFISIIFDLLRKKSISLIRQNGEYYFIDQKLPDEVLSKSEESVKKLIFTEMGNKENVSLTNIINALKKNSGYIYNEYKSFKTTFEYECAGEKYFKSTRSIMDSSMFFFVLSMILAIYNLIFAKKVIFFILIFGITSFLVRVVNNFKNIEEEKIAEYKSWLEFKNYINSNNDLDKLDINTLEMYSLYAYVLDSYDSFKIALKKKYQEDNNSLNDSVLLSIMNVSLFDYIESEINKSLNVCKFKSVVLFARNKGRR